MRYLDNSNTTSDRKSTTFDQSSFYVERDYPHYLLIDSDILENIGSWSYSQRGWKNPGLVVHTHKRPLTLTASV